MPVVVFLALLAALGLLLVLAGRRDGDLPARLVSAVADRLPEHRREWGPAMVAELTQVRGRVRRWRFAAGALRVLLFPPPHRGRVVVVAAVGLAVAAAATVSAAREVPTLSVFAGTLGLLLCACATLAAAHWPRRRPGAPYVAVATLALAAAVATVATLVRVAVLHPSATADGTHVFSVLFAVVLAGYLAVALIPPRAGGRANALLLWALAAALAGGAVWIAIAATVPADPSGITGLMSPVSAAAVLLASVGAAATTGSMPAGARAGVLTVALTAPIHFAADIGGVLHLGHYTLTDPYDVAAFARGGYPDVASFLLSDQLGGEIVSGFVLYPVALLALALLGAAAGTRLDRFRIRRAA